jgi:thioredoxin reductase (NADPH)
MITAGHLRDIPLFADLPDSEREALAARSADVHLRVNDWLIQEGELPSFFFLLSGRIAVTKLIGGVERLLIHYGPGDFFGELPLLLGAPAIASLRAEEPSRVGRLDAADFRTMVATCPTLNARLLQTMATRVQHVQQVQSTAPIATVTLVGHRYDIACHALRDFLSRNHVAFRWEDLHEHGAPREGDAFPLVILPDGRRLATPTFRDVADALGLATRPQGALYDVVVIGAGPAGLAAAVYGASEGLRTLLVERHAPGGQAAMFFANYARSVTLLVRGPTLADSMSHYLIEQLNA